MIQVRVDAERCEGNAVCLALAPEVFELDDSGLAYVLPGEPATERQDDVRRAVDGCPREALLLAGE